MTRFEIGKATSAGPQRPVNQDSLFVEHRDGGPSRGPWMVAAIADGMGGLAAAEVASDAAITGFIRAIGVVRRVPTPEALRLAFTQAHDEVRSRVRGRTDEAGMGTTLVAIAAGESVAYVANVGDSRAYTMRGIHLEQCTNDHTAPDPSRDGPIRHDGVQRGPLRGLLTRYLGSESVPAIDIFGPFEVSERLCMLLLSDGIHAVLSTTEIEDLVQIGSCQEAAERLIHAARASGGVDDASAIVIRFSR